MTRRTPILLAILAASLVLLRFRGPLQAFARGVDGGALSGKAAPELPPAVRALDAPAPRLVDLRGQVVLLHFWTFG